MVANNPDEQLKVMQNAAKHKLILQVHLSSTAAGFVEYTATFDQNKTYALMDILPGRF